MSGISRTLTLLTFHVRRVGGLICPGLLLLDLVGG